MALVEHRHRDGPAGHQRPEGERARGRRVVRTHLRAAIRGRIVHRRRGEALPAQARHELERRLRTFLGLRVRHRELRRTRDDRPQDPREHPPVGNAHLGRVVARRRRFHRQRDVAEARRRRPQPPSPVAALLQTAGARDVAARHLEQRVPHSLVAQPVRLQVETELDLDRRLPVVLVRRLSKIRCERLPRHQRGHALRQRPAVGRADRVRIVARANGEHDGDVAAMRRLGAHLPTTVARGIEPPRAGDR